VTTADAVDASIGATIDAICRAAAHRPGALADVVDALVDELDPLATDDRRRRLVRASIARLDGLDVLDALLADPEVDEVMVNAGTDVWIDRGGRLTRAERLPAGAIEVILERVLAPLGHRLDRLNPVVDARLPDGARLCAVIAPLAVDGTCVAIRRHRRRRVRIDAFAPPDAADVLRDAVAARANLLVTGATSSGKTTLLSALLAEVEPTERLVVVEDTAELTLDQHHAVRLETRAGNVDGVTPVDAGSLVRTALRLRPDRLVVGEFRGVEAVAVVEALNTGHDGSLSTCHANSALDGLRRLGTLVMQGVPAWPLAAIRRQVSRSIDLVVHLERTSDGHRRIVEIVEIDEHDGEPTGRPIWESASRRSDSPRPPSCGPQRPEAP
jgi:pilus assembly protein CpaF